MINVIDEKKIVHPKKFIQDYAKVVSDGETEKMVKNFKRRLPC